MNLKLIKKTPFIIIITVCFSFAAFTYINSEKVETVTVSDYANDPYFNEIDTEEQSSKPTKKLQSKKMIVSNETKDNLNPYECLIAVLKAAEAQGRKGKEFHIYPDGGVPTIGYGTHLNVLSHDDPKLYKVIRRSLDFKGYIDETYARKAMVSCLNVNMVFFEKQALKKGLKFKRNHNDTVYRKIKALGFLSYHVGIGTVMKISKNNPFDISEKTWKSIGVVNPYIHKRRASEYAMYSGKMWTLNKLGMEAFTIIKKRGDLSRGNHAAANKAFI